MYRRNYDLSRRSSQHMTSTHARTDARSIHSTFLKIRCISNGWIVQVVRNLSHIKQFIKGEKYKSQEQNTKRMERRSCRPALPLELVWVWASIVLLEGLILKNYINVHKNGFLLSLEAILCFQRLHSRLVFEWKSLAISSEGIRSQWKRYNLLSYLPRSLSQIDIYK